MLSRIAAACIAVFILALGHAFLSAPAVSSAPAMDAASPTPSASSTAPGERTYTVVAGDNPWAIAQKMYGSGIRYPLILSANHLTETSILTIGMVLVIPPLPAALGAATATPPPTDTQTPTLIPPSATPTAEPTGTPVPTPTATPIRTAQGVFTNWIATTASPGWATVLDILGWVCTLSSLVCAFLGYQGYHRARRLRRMMIMSQRARARL
ncbi:MAG TPA: LysM peptidoglycan-binding domain-containing protein [Armatimonadota bacterium]|nr:LysM peptidoglycan-binding domain-containing protein [Armatimonadota bacterium]